MRTLTEAPMAALGERFRAARESRGLTLSDVAEHIRIRSVYLAAIEEEQWGAIGAPVYIRGFLRTYARYLGIDPEEAVSEFNASSGAAALAAEPLTREFSARQDAGLSPIIWVASVVAVLLVALVIYNYFSLRHAPAAPVAVESSSPNAPSAAPSAAGAIASAEPVLKADRTLTLHLLGVSWLRVTVDGNVSIEGTFPAGTSKTFHGAKAVLRVGNAGGVEVTVDGKAVGPLGRVGDVVERTFTL